MEKSWMNEFYEMADAITRGVDAGRSELSLFNEASECVVDYMLNLHCEDTARLAAKAFVALTRFNAVGIELDKGMARYCLGCIMLAVEKGDIDREEMKRYIIEYGALKKKGKS